MYNFAMCRRKKKWKYVNIFVNSFHVFFSVYVPLSLMLPHFYVVSVLSFHFSVVCSLSHSFIPFENWKKTLCNIHSLDFLHTPKPYQMRTRTKNNTYIRHTLKHFKTICTKQIVEQHIVQHKNAQCKNSYHNAKRIA